jgi:alpha-tubulin suppressor-like RCC1 family protein
MPAVSVFAVLAASCSPGTSPSFCAFRSIGTLTNATVGVSNQGSLWAWGNTSKVGAGNPAPELYRSSSEIVSVASRTDTVCETHLDGSQLCHGASLLIKEFTEATELAVTTSPSLVINDARACVLHRDSHVECWDDNAVTNTPFVLPDLPGPVGSLALGDKDAQEGCAVTTDQRVWCWGGGILGDGSAPREQPAAATEIVALRDKGQRVALSRGSKCALTTDGQVFCWGRLLDPTSPALLPAAIDVGASATALVMGDDHACALTVEGRVVCWGDNTQGQTSSVDSGRGPRQVPLGVPVVLEIVAGAMHTCARRDDTTVFCWGLNDHAQLGHPDLADPSSAQPVRVEGCPPL